MSRRERGLNLLNPEFLIKTGPVDHADWNYRPLLGSVSHLRFWAGRRLLPERVENLLEVGYGSGIFLPEPALHCRHLYGMDIHTETQQVAALLAGLGMSATLRNGSAGNVPFASGMFDCVASVSALEFVSDLRAASGDLGRVVKPGGCLVVRAPGDSPILDLGLRVLAGVDPKADFSARRG